MVLGPVSKWNLHLSVRKHKLVIAVASIPASSVGLVMFMFADAIFVSMSKSHHRNDALDQQERVRHLWPYLPLESIHHRSGHLTLCRAYIIAMLRVHHYIVSPATLFRVLWRTHFKNRRISSHGSSSHHLWHLHQRFVRLSTSPWFIVIDCDAFTNDSSVCLHLHASGVHLTQHDRDQFHFHRVSFPSHLKVDLTKVKGTKWVECCGRPTHFVDYWNNTWHGPRFHKENKTRVLLTGVEGDVFLDHERNLLSVDDDYSHAEEAYELVK